MKPMHFPSLHAGAAALLCGSLLLAACGAPRTSIGGSGDSPREQGEAKLNGWIGRSMANSFLETDPLVQRKDFDANRLQYIMPDKSGCTIGFIVDRKTRILMSWSYLREPEKCWVSQSSGS